MSLRTPALRRLITGAIGSLSCAAALAIAGCAHPPAAPASVKPPAPPAAGQVATARFEDVTARAGIAFRHRNSRSPRKYLVETMGAGCAFIDYNADGWQDVLLLNDTQIPGGEPVGRPTMRLYRNDRNGRFTDVTHATGLDNLSFYAMGAAVGDYDNDGRDDLYVTGVLGPSHLFHNEGGRFRDVTATAGVGNPGMWGTSAAWVDYDKDGRLDLFVCNYVKYRSLADDQPCYAGAHQLTYCIPSAYESSHCTLYHNEGAGRFRDVTAASGIGAASGKSLGVAVFDYDGDGWPDIFVANDTVPGNVFHNQGNGTFRDVGVETGVAFNDEGIPHSGMGIDVGDIGSAGDAHVVLTNYYGQQTSFYRQAGPTAFVDAAAASRLGPLTAKLLGFGVFFFDYDNDGYKDALQVNGHVQDDIEQREPQTAYKEPTCLFHNQGDGTFVETGQASGAPFTKRIVGRGAAWGDIDNDGRLDVLITANNGPAMLWRNATPATGHWLTVRLSGAKSNRSGIGATVQVTAGGLTQRSIVRSGSSYLSASELSAHFGLGRERAAQVEVHWPSGTVDRLGAVAADQIVVVREARS